MKDQATFDVFTRFAPGRLQPDRHRGWLKMDRQEGRPPLLGLLHEDIGGHNLKAGAESRWNFLDYAQPGYPSGQFTFGRGSPARIVSPARATRATAGAMLLGWPSGGDFHIDPKVFTRSAYWGFYVHDDWRIVPKLTLNLGLRYDFDVPRWETQDRMSYWDLEAQSPYRCRLRHPRRHQVRGRERRSPFDGT